MDTSVKIKSCMVRMEPLSPNLLRSVNVRLSPLKKETMAALKKESPTKSMTPYQKMMARREQVILLPKKKGKKDSAATSQKIKGTRVDKSKKRKFKLKIRKDSGRVSSPDSGFSSRPLTPEDEDEEETKDEEEEEANIQDTAKSDLLKALDEGSDSEDDDEADDEEDWQEGNESKWTSKQKKRKKTFEKIEIEPIEKSDFEKARDKNIREREALMAALKAQWTTFKEKSRPQPKPRSYTPRAPRIEFNGELRRSGRTIGGKVEYQELDDSTPIRKPRGGAGFDEKGYIYAQREKQRGAGTRSHLDPNQDILMPEAVTQQMLDKVYVHLAGRKKEYCQVSGSSCHQCRQKTKDTKTVCRSGVCVGVRGQFCGSCLTMRYGEDAKEVLMDPVWKCPVCRGICNCSFCLQTPTGQLFHLARSRGFPSVHHYLQHLRGTWDQEGSGSDEGEEEEKMETDADEEEKDE